MHTVKKWYLVLSSLCFACMAMFIKFTAPYIPAHELLFVRYIGGALGCLLVDRSCFRIHPGSSKILFLRGLYGTIAMFSFFYAIYYAPISRVVILGFSYPIFEVVFAAIWMRERPEKIVYFSLPIAMLGIYYVTNPALGFEMGDILGLMCGIFGGLAIISVRKARMNNSATTIFFYFAVFGIIATLIPNVLDFKVPPVESLGLIGAVIFFGTTGQIIMHYAYKYAKVGEGSIISLLTVIFANVLGFLFMGEKITSRLLLGELLVVASIGILIIRKRQKAGSEI